MSLMWRNLTGLHLNPIESLWDELEQRLWARPSRPASVPDLTNVLQEELSKIPINTPKPFGKPFQKSWSCYMCKGSANSIYMMYEIWYVMCDIWYVSVWYMINGIMHWKKKKLCKNYKYHTVSHTESLFLSMRV